MTKIELLPSILASNFAQLGCEAQAAIEGGGTALHVDVMDGHFVPNLTVGPPLVASLRKVVSVPLDCHLMVEDPDLFIPAFADLDRTLHLIAQHGCKPGVVVNPATPVELLTEVLDLVHHVLVMSVNPGFGGQRFIPNSLNKIAALARMRAERKLDFRIEVDGGIDLTTVADVVKAGAELLVIGTGVFGHGDIRANAAKLLEAARSATFTRV